MNLIILLILFLAVTLVAHSLFALYVGDELDRLGLDRTKWTLFILVGGIPALLVYRKKRTQILDAQSKEKP